MTRSDEPSDRPSTLAPIEKAPDDERVALSYAQDLYWFLNLVESGNAAYNTVAGVRLRGTLSRERFEQALRATLARHESLATFIGVQDGVGCSRRLAEPNAS